MTRANRTATETAGRDARLLVYEGAPHGLFVTHAARLSRDIADWLAA